MKPTKQDWIVGLLVLWGIVLGIAYAMTPASTLEAYERARQKETAAAAAAKPADHPREDTTDQYVRQILIPEMTAMCDKPVSQMTMQDIEDCNKPGMRALRSAR